MELNKQTVVKHPETGEVITLFAKVDKEGIMYICENATDYGKSTKKD